MTTLFVSHAKENAECAEQMRKEFEASDYTTWRDPAYPDRNSASYPQMIEHAILRSAALVLVWSSSAAQDEWVERHVLFAQSLKKPLFPVLLDSTALPTTLVAVSPLAHQSTCNADATSLMTLSSFPAAHSTDPFLTLCEQAGHELIRVRKEAIDAAVQMLARGEHREQVLALLEYLAQHDALMGVRDKAQGVLDSEAAKAAPPPPFLQPADARYMFGVRCKNGHVSYFDKRVVCSASVDFPRMLKTSARKELDELILHCTTPGCGLEVSARVDCGDYK